MYCPFCPGRVLMKEDKYDYHQLSSARINQPVNTMLSVLYVCPECGVRVETTRQVRVMPALSDWKKETEKNNMQLESEKADKEKEEMVVLLEMGGTPELQVHDDLFIKKEADDEGEDTTIGGDEHLQDPITS